ISQQVVHGWVLTSHTSRCVGGITVRPPIEITLVWLYIVCTNRKKMSKQTCCRGVLFFFPPHSCTRQFREIWWTAGEFPLEEERRRCSLSAEVGCPPCTDFRGLNKRCPRFGYFRNKR
ncbi:unnamed protein product, partial [Ectocarpus sp. 8 AP-2014]